MRREQPSGTGRSSRGFGTITVTRVAVPRSASACLSLGNAIASPRTARTAKRRFIGISSRSCSQPRPFGSDAAPVPREVAVDALQIVARGAGAFGDALGEPAGLGRGVAGTLEIAGDARALALALGALGRETRGLLAELVVAPQERPVLVRQPDLVA